MKYGIAWLLGVPGSIVLLWFLCRSGRLRFLDERPRSLYEFCGM